MGTHQEPLLSRNVWYWSKIDLIMYVVIEWCT